MPSTRPLRSDDRLVIADDGSVIGLAAAGDRPSRMATLWAPTGGAQALRDANNAVHALFETMLENLATASATSTVLTGAGEYFAYRCTVAAGNITVYDSLTAAGKVLVPTTALVLGTYPIFGAGINKTLAVTIGITVVLSGAATVQIVRPPN